MSMNVIDCSSYQASLDLNNMNYDGVAIKATEGNGYVNPYCDIHFQEAKAAGKKRVVYHFYDFDVDPVTQADYFVDNCIGYIRDAIFVLDWEGHGVDNVNAAQTFLQRVEARIGYKPAIYMSQWVENTYDWSAVVNNDNGLWVARYSNWELDNHAHDWDMSNAGQAPTVVHWPFYFMWQWTSTGLLSGYAGNLDCDIAYLTPDAWDKYAGIRTDAPQPESTTTTTTTEAPVEPVTTTTTTVAPAPAESDVPASTTTTTTAAPADTPSAEPSDSTTTTTTQAHGQGEPVQGPSLLTAIVAAVLAVVITIFKRLQGIQK